MSTATITSDDVKAKALELGAQLVGIASADSLAAEPTPPTAVLNGAQNVVVIARRFVYGGARLRDARARTAHYAMELGLSELEDTALKLMFYLEDAGYPSLMLPAASSRSKQEDLRNSGPVSLVQAAIEAGLGTMGLNEMLLTPQYGARVILAAVVTLAPLEADARMTEALCLGESCGRCLLTCPGNAVGQWKLDVEACRPHSAPYDYPFLQQHVGKIVAEPDPKQKWKIATSTDSLMIWQSMLRGVGVETGCTRCQDVCPVGEDYERYLADVLDEIPEETADKRAELERMQAAAETGDHGPHFASRRRYIGTLDTNRGRTRDDDGNPPADR